MPDGTNAVPAATRRIFERVPPHIRASLTVEQREAIAIAADEPDWADHPVNFRFSLPSPLGRFYMVIVGGRDRRGGARREHETGRNPFRKRGNLAFVIVAAVLFYVLALAAGRLI